MHHGWEGAERGSCLMHHMKGCKREGGLRLVTGMMHHRQEGAERGSRLMHHMKGCKQDTSIICCSHLMHHIRVGRRIELSDASQAVIKGGQGGAKCDSHLMHHMAVTDEWCKVWVTRVMHQVNGQAKTDALHGG